MEFQVEFHPFEQTWLGSFYSGLVARFVMARCLEQVLGEAMFVCPRGGGRRGVRQSSPLPPPSWYFWRSLAGDQMKELKAELPK